MELLNSVDWEALHQVLLQNTLVQVLLTIITTLVILIIVQHSIGVLVRRSMWRVGYSQRRSVRCGISTMFEVRKNLPKNDV